MYQQINKGAANPSVRVKVVDNPTGLPETSVSASGTGLTLWYERERGGRTNFTAFNLANASASWTQGGFIHIAAGYCRMDIPDAAVTVGANTVLCGVDGLTSMVGIATLVDLTEPISLSAGGVKVSAFSADAFDSSAIASSAVTKIQAGLALTTSLSALTTLVTTINNKTSSLSFASGNVLSRMVSGAADAIDSSVIAASAVTKIQVGLAPITSISALTTLVNTIAAKTSSLSFVSGNVLSRMVTAAADAIDSSVVAASAVTKIQVGLAPITSISALTTLVNSLAASVSGIATQATAINNKTSSLSFVSGRALIDLRAINGTAINGDGSGTPFGP